MLKPERLVISLEHYNYSLERIALAVESELNNRGIVSDKVEFMGYFWNDFESGRFVPILNEVDSIITSPPGFSKEPVVVVCYDVYYN